MKDDNNIKVEKDNNIIMKDDNNNVNNKNDTSKNIQDKQTINSLIQVTNPKNCSHCQQCLRTNRPFSKNIRIEELPNQFHFIIETHGSIPVRKLFSRACDAMIGKAQNMLEQIPI